MGMSATLYHYWKEVVDNGKKTSSESKQQKREEESWTEMEKATKADYQKRREVNQRVQTRRMGEAFLPVHGEAWD
jgi:hypothetical protein